MKFNASLSKFWLYQSCVRENASLRLYNNIVLKVLCDFYCLCVISFQIRFNEAISPLLSIFVKKNIFFLCDTSLIINCYQNTS